MIAAHPYGIDEVIHSMKHSIYTFLNEEGQYTKETRVMFAAIFMECMLEYIKSRTSSDEMAQSLLYMMEHQPVKLVEKYIGIQND